jgi:hypothetical protein
MGNALKDTLKHFFEVYHGRENQRRIDLITKHNNHEITEKIPVYFSVPFDWSIARMNLWMQLLNLPLDIEAIMSATGEYPVALAEQVIIFQLKQRIFYIEQMPGDWPVSPSVSTNFNLLWIMNKDRMNPIWNEIDYNLNSGDFHLEPFINSEADFDRIAIQPYHFDPELHRKRLAIFSELTEGNFTIQDDNLGFGYLSRPGSPFEETCRVRGMINVLMDMRENPAFVHRMMAYFTNLSIKRAEEMNDKTGKDCFMPSIGGDDVNCQMFSSDDYTEFIYPYEMQCSKYGTNYYYHSCGRLTPVYKLIANLQNLAKVHVSPWSDLQTAVDVFKDRKVIIQKLMDTQKDILNRNTGEMLEHIRNIKVAINASVAEVACHCETVGSLEKSKEFVRMAGELLTRK